MQVVNEYFGGTLKKVDGHVRVNHFIKINNLELIVNSYHGYAVDKLGEGLKIDAVYEGVIEAVSSNDGLIKCIMWHPERTTHQDLYIETVV